MKMERVTTLKSETTKIIAEVAESRDPAMFTQHGRPAASLMDITTPEGLRTFANVAAPSNQSAEVAQSFAANRMAGRSAEASLDLYEMAIIAQDMTGDYFLRTL